MGVLTKLFPVAPVAAVGLMAGACSTAPKNFAPCIDNKGVQVAGIGYHNSSYNERCGQRDVAIEMIKSKDPAAASVGYKMLRKMDPAVGDAIDETVRDALNQPRKLECQVTGVNRSGGKTEISMGNCMPTGPIPAHSPIMPVATPAKKQTPIPGVPVSMGYGLSTLRPMFS